MRPTEKLFMAITAALVLTLLLSGCASWFKKPEPIVTTTTVEVAVPVACKFDVKKPEDRLTALQPSTNILIKGNALLEENMNWRVYGAQVEAASKACSDIIEASKKK